MKLFRLALLTAALAAAQDRTEIQRFVDAHQHQIVGEL
jgi:hypothetical protein